MATALYLVAALVLLLLNAFFVLAEFAAVSLRASRLEELIQQGRRGAKVAQHVHNHLDEYLSMCQVGITFASIALGFVGERAAADLLLPVLSLFGGYSQLVAHGLATALTAITVSFLHILLGEQVPKLVAIRIADRAALLTAQPLRWSRWVFFAPLWLLNKLSSLILRLLGFRGKAEREQHSEDELRIILARFQSGGLLSFRRLLFMENIFDFGDLRVRDTMRTRSQVRVLHTQLHWIDTEQFIRTWKYSRYPLIDQDPERPIGFIHIKDVFLSSRKAGEEIDLRSLARPLLTVTESTPLEVLLADLQRRRNQAALVTDQAGKWTGFITMEDIIEEIIGTVDDEFAVEPPPTLAEVLTVGRIVLGVEADSLGEAIRLALTLVPAAELPLRADAIARAVMERERLASTYLGHGLAMPHARLPGLEKAVLLVVRSSIGIPVDGSSEKASLLFVLLTPAGQPRVHQRLQARIAELIENSDYVEQRLRKAATPLEMLDTIRTGEQAAID
jgi:CBS domain containing-hemolysin-like protein